MLWLSPQALQISLTLLISGWQVTLKPSTLICKMGEMESALWSLLRLDEMMHVEGLASAFRRWWLLLVLTIVQKPYQTPNQDMSVMNSF